jgi:Protein of unknown function (DUF3093)
MDFEERIFPSLGTIAALLALLIASAFAVWVALGTVIAGAILSLGFIFIFLWWRGAIHRIRIEENFLYVNDAKIEASYISTVRSLGEDAWRKRRGVDFDPALFHAHKFWMRSGVEITLDDPRDPHDGWLIGSKHYDELAASISAMLRAQRKK